MQRRRIRSAIEQTVELAHSTQCYQRGVDSPHAWDKRETSLQDSRARLAEQARREDSRSEVRGSLNFEPRTSHVGCCLTRCTHPSAQPAFPAFPACRASLASRASRALRVPFPQILRLALLLGHPTSQDKQCVAEAIQKTHESLIQRLFSPQSHTDTFSPPADRSGLV